MHVAAFQWVRAVVESSESPIRRVLELGSRTVNGTVSELFPDAAGQYVGVDLEAGAGVTIVGDAATIQLPDRFDAVVCCETLEHATDPVGIVRNGLRHLVPGGMMIITAAGPSREPHSVDGGPLKPGEYYQSVTRAMLAEGFRPMAEPYMIDEWSVPGDIRAVAWRASHISDWDDKI